MKMTVALAAALLALASPAKATQIGVYAGPGCAGVEYLGVYKAWLGSPAMHVTENFNQNSWPELASGAGWSIECYAAVRNSINMTFSIPMLPADGVSTLAKGAAGEYDHYFRDIANQLVKYGFQTTIVRLGWEFNGSWQPWFASNPTDYISYFRRIVDLMKAVPGARFQFEWCPNIGPVNMPADQAYPGDQYVDIIGMDIYDAHYGEGDATPPDRWAFYVSEPFGLQWHVDFAKAHMKPLSFPEWGCCGNNAGDDPYFIDQMALWQTTHSYLYSVYWDSNAAYRGQLSNNQYPYASARYKAHFNRMPQ